MSDLVVQNEALDQACRALVKKFICRKLPKIALLIEYLKEENCYFSITYSLIPLSSNKVQKPQYIK